MNDLAVVSHRADSNGRVLLAYNVDDIDTVGVFGKEPYGIRYNNRTGSLQEVRISVDGTDVMSGRKATLDPRDGVKTFIARPYSSFTLDAWPETDREGARFVFTDPGSSVAAHTHGDLGAQGYISVAVFIEGRPAPIYRPPVHFGNDFGGHSYGGTLESLGTTRATKGASSVGTGAGEVISQKLGSARGLFVPQFDHITQLRYVWWDELVARLVELGIQPSHAHPTGFVGSPGQPLANLGSTPRPGSTAVATRVVTTAPAMEYPRFD